MAICVSNVHEIIMDLQDLFKKLENKKEVRIPKNGGYLTLINIFLAENYSKGSLDINNLKNEIAINVIENLIKK